MKKLLFILQISTILALSIPTAVSAASTSSEQESMFTNLVALNKRQLQLTMSVKEYERIAQSGIDTEMIINQAHQELGENATKIKALEQQLEQAGYAGHIIQSVVDESLFNQLTNEQLEQISAFVDNS